MKVPNTVLIDLTYRTILGEVNELMAQRGLSASEMEIVLTKVMLAIKASKEKDYAETILDLVYQIQQKEKEADMQAEPINMEEPNE